VEAEKVPMRAGGEEKERALAVLDYALFRILKLLHPFMPFITEELAHRMGFVEEGKFLMYEEFPTVGSGRSNAEKAVLTDAKFELIRAGRFLRSSYNLPDGKKLNFHVKAANDEMASFLTAELASLKSLLNANEIEISTEAFDTAAHGAGAGQTVVCGVITLPLADLIDIDAEVARLKKQMADLEKWIAGTKGRLANEKFVNSAPAQVVADTRSKLAELEQKAEETQKLLAVLSK
jgi:valyl-tRNA synthetase